MLDTGAVTRGSGSKNEDKERNIRKWFVDHDLIDGVILLPDNLFYNTTAAGVIVVLNKRKPAARKDKIVLLNASQRLRRASRRTTSARTDVSSSRRLVLGGEPVDGEIAIIDDREHREADYNLSPSRWVQRSSDRDEASISDALVRLQLLDTEAAGVSATLYDLLNPVAR